MNKKTFWIVGVVVSVVHGGFTFLSIIISYGTSMKRFDDPDHDVSAVLQTANEVAEVLMLPGSIVWTSWMSRNMPDIVEWTLFLANSAVWGFGAAFVIKALSIRGSGIRREIKSNDLA